MQDRAFLDLLATTLPTSPQLQTIRREIYRGQLRLLKRAEAAGSLRDDLTALQRRPAVVQRGTSPA